MIEENGIVLNGSIVLNGAIEVSSLDFSFGGEEYRLSIRADGMLELHKDTLEYLRICPSYRNQIAFK